LASHHAHEAVLGNIDNLPNPFVRCVLRIFGAPLGLRFSLPDDHLMSTVASSILDGDARRENLTSDVFVPNKDDPALGRLEHALKVAKDVLPLKKKLRIARKAGTIQARYGEQMLIEGIEANIITSNEAEEIRKYDQLLSDVVDVDDFDQKTYQNLK
jgi:acyl-CoA dehydrogenase